MAGLLFDGVVVAVDLSVNGEENKEVEGDVKMDVDDHGGTVVEADELTISKHFLEKKVTHVVVSTLDSELAKRAKRVGAKGLEIVTETWVERCIESNEVLPVDSEVIFSPAKTSHGISSEMKDLVVCVTGYSGARRYEMRELVLRTGARYSGTLNHSCTHLICYKYEGEKYNMARKWQASRNLPRIVNHRWLEDCCRTWTYLSELVYEEKCGRDADMEPRIPLHDLVRLEVENSVSQDDSEEAEEERGHRSRYSGAKSTNRTPARENVVVVDPVVDQEKEPKVSRNPTPLPTPNQIRKAFAEAAVEPEVLVINGQIVVNSHQIRRRVQAEAEAALEPEVNEDVVDLPNISACPEEEDKENFVPSPHNEDFTPKSSVGKQGSVAETTESAGKSPNTKPVSRGLRELKGLQPFAWDSRRERFPPGEKLSNKVQNLARKRVQPDRLEATPFKDPNSKKRRSLSHAHKEAPANPGPAKKAKQEPKQKPKSKVKPSAKKAVALQQRPKKVEGLQVSLSGMRSKVRARCLKYSDKCGIEISEIKSKEWREGTTHVVTPQLGRSEKTLAALASGSWIMKESWLRDSAKAGRVLKEEAPYFADSRQDTLVSCDAARLWLDRYQKTKQRAFQGLEAYFHKDCAQNAPSRDTLLRIFRAGSGTVADSMTGDGSEKINFAVVSNPNDDTDPFVRGCLARNVVCVSDLFLIEWLALPTKDLTDHLRLHNLEACNPAAADLLDERFKSQVVSRLR